MKIGESVSVSNLVADTNQTKKSEVNASTVINLEKSGGAKLLEKTLDALAQSGWSDVRKIEQSKVEPTLDSETIKQKEQLEAMGLKVTVRPDGKFIVENSKEHSMWVSSEEIRNVAILKGDFSIYNGAPQSDVEYPNLETVVGNFTISGFNDECRTSGPNWGYACDVEFPNLKEVVGNINIQNSACQLYLDSLEKVGGTFNVDASCQTDNQVFLKNVESINGDFNIQVGCVHASPQIFSAVDGIMNEIPPQSHSTNGFGSCLIIGQQPNEKYYEFTTEKEVIKKYNLG